MPNKYLIISFLIFNISVVYGWKDCKSSSTYEEEMDRVLSQFHKKEGKRLEKKYEMTFCGYGSKKNKKVSFDNNKIEVLRLTFQRYILQDESSARKLITDCAHEYLESVNKSKKLQPFLQEFPFSVKNLEITILNNTFSRSFVLNPFISIIDIKRGELIYFMTRDSNYETLEIYKREPYEDALAIIKKQKEEATSNLQNNCE